MDPLSTSSVIPYMLLLWWYASSCFFFVCFVSLLFTKSLKMHFPFMHPYTLYINCVIFHTLRVQIAVLLSNEVNVLYIVNMTTTLQPGLGAKQTKKSFLPFVIISLRQSTQITQAKWTKWSENKNTKQKIWKMLQKKNLHKCRSNEFFFVFFATYARKHFVPF